MKWVESILMVPDRASNIKADEKFCQIEVSMARLYDYLYFAFIFGFLCGDLPFFVTKKSGTIHIIRTKMAKCWFIFNSVLNIVLLIFNGLNFKETLLFTKGRNINSMNLIFIFSRFMMLLYTVQRLFLRQILLRSATNLWEKLMQFDRKWEMAKHMDLDKLIWKSRFKLIFMQFMNFSSSLMWGIKYDVDFFGICCSQYLTTIYTSLLYSYHVFYILIDEMMRQLISELNTSENSHKIKELSAVFADIMEISRKCNAFLSVYLFAMFSFIGIQVVIYIYSLYKYTKNNSVFTTISVVFYIVSSICFSIGWFVFLAENCLEKV